MLDIQRFWEMVIFSWMTGNSDMHCKNFSLLYKEGIGYTLSPAYDLLSVVLTGIEDNDELAMPLTGYGIDDTQNIGGIDKTAFIEEWWESCDSVTLITRPRRFGKTLNMSMIEEFFSVDYAGRGDLFEGLFIWEEEKYRNLQGTYPVISLSFAGVKDTDYESTEYHIRELLRKEYEKHCFLMESNVLSEVEKVYYQRMREEMKPLDVPMSLHNLSDFLSRYYGKRSLFYWMNTTLRCRKLMFMASGMK